MNTGRATGLVSPGGANGRRKLLAAGLAIVVLCTAGTGWFLLGDGPFPGPQATGPSRTGDKAAKARGARQAGPKTAALPGARTDANKNDFSAASDFKAASLADTGQPVPATGNPASAMGQAPGQGNAGGPGGPTGSADPTDQAASSDRVARDKSGKEKAFEEPESLADFRPASVYSGTLGEMTRLQADSQIAMADLALREVRAKLAKLEREAAANAGEAPGKNRPNERDEQMTSLERRVQAAIDEMLARLDRAEQSRGGVWQVLAVRGRNGALEAELLGARGRRLVRVGDELENGMTVDEITRTNVRLAGRTLPWR